MVHAIVLNPVLTQARLQCRQLELARSFTGKSSCRIPNTHIPLR